MAVVVAYNRRDLLLECLDALARQSRAVDAVVVVDNASTDGGGEAARHAHGSVDLVTLRANTGGAGGFAAGMRRALESHDPDLVWLMDDDTIPTETALAELLRVHVAHPGLRILGSKAVWTDGSEHPMNTPKPRLGAGSASRAQAARFGAIPIRSASFVSMLVDADAIREHGLPIADYFIWNDDFEYSTRLLRRGEGWYVPTSVVVHKTKTFGSSDADPGERFYYEVRNKLWLFRFAGTLSWWEAPLYWGATVRRWVRTRRRAMDPAVLMSAGRRGWRDGWRSRPRETGEVLIAAGYPR
ncbi:glycosyltransferase [Pseudolysinimonas sp.]|uniref:glycosyltransferase n=1 Tax=Pseudolysinimonas sp. TaxID=2680009 RepID=UPI003F80BD23